MNQTPTQNPHFAHGIGIGGLCHNLQNHPQEWSGCLFTQAYDPQRLAAIARQAENVKEQAITGLRTVGALLAAAMQSGELADQHALNTGFLVEFLAEVVDHFEVVESNAAHVRDHGTPI
jgi:hypothetical protein